MLGNIEIRRLIEEHELIKDYIDLETQLQPTGFDFTVKRIEQYINGGSIDFDNSNRLISASISIKKDVNNAWRLVPGVYRVRFNEELNIRDIPYPISVISCYRGSVMRNGNYTSLGFWDYGYRGKGECSLNICNPYGFTVYQDARIHQCFFFKATAVSQVYNGEYLFEK